MNTLMVETETAVSIENINEAICLVLLKGKYAGRALYLTLDSHEITELANLLGISEDVVENTIADVVGQHLDRGRNPFLTVSREARDWASAGMVGNPPFVALLHVLSHAAEHMADDGRYAANAYYPRLASLVQLPSAKLRANGKHTALFWRLFETWLAENDFELGRPTASGKGTWKYVGLAMSQAIVRTVDREALHELFESYGFSSGDRFSTDEIHPYLEDWIRSSHSTSRLRKVWEQKDLRERICEIAIDEFQDWSTGHSRSSIGEAVQKSRRLTLVAQVVPSFPTPKLSMHLGRTVELSQTVSGLEDKLGNRYSVSNSTFGAFATVSPNPMGRANSGLSRTFSAKSSDFHLHWSSGLIIPLVESGEGPYWTEIARASFGIPHMVLVRNKPAIVEKLEALLEATSTGEATYFTSADVIGIPEGWRLYRDIRIISAPTSNIVNDLLPLVPISRETGISVAGGMQLARGIWHSAVPPTVNFFAQSAPTRLEAHRPSDHGLRLSRENQSDSRTCHINLKNLEDASYTVRGFNDKVQLDEKLILLRSAARARPLARRSFEKLVYTGILSASEESSNEQKVFASGNVVTPKPIVIEISSVVEANCQMEIPSGEAGPDIEPDDFVNDEVVSQEPLSCAARGHHVWKCESPPKRVSMSTPLKMECKDCNLAVIARNRGKKKTQIANAKSVVTRNLNRGTWKNPSIDLNIDFDLLFDALCFLGSGSWGRLDKILAGNDLPAWGFGELAGTLSSLGLIDVAYGHETHRPIKWSVPPPAICMTGKGMGFLSGFRCEPLTDLIFESIKATGGNCFVKEQRRAPSVLGFASVEVQELSERIRALKDPLGRPISLIERPALDLARALTSLAGFASVLTPISTGASLRNLQKFEAVNARWRSIENISCEGAYRFDYSGRSYVYCAPDGRKFLGPQQVIKLLAARQEKIRLHRYDSVNRKFLSTRGAEPIGLLSRALVACSGRVPRSGDNGMTYYEEVDPEVGFTVIDMMYSRKIIE